MRLKNVWLHVAGTLAHKACVFWFSIVIAFRIVWRGFMHDWSKLHPSEAAGFVNVIHNLKGSTYGSPEYKASLASIKPSIDLHYKRNRHHPEHFGSAGMRAFTLVDMVEMYCDWRAAVLRHEDGCINRSIEFNQKRFGFSDDVRALLENSVGDIAFRNLGPLGWFWESEPENRQHAERMDYFGLTADQRNDMLAWAFGKQYAALTPGQLQAAWNHRHAKSLFVLTPQDDMPTQLERIAKLWRFLHP